MAYSCMSPYSQSEMEDVMHKAENYVSGGCLTSCKYFMRDKSEEYFDDILYYGGGVMRPYLKDDHGDPRCPLNEALAGLFFSTDADDAARYRSIYGPQRFEVKASALINSKTRAYLADFYCVPGKSTPRPHYITITLTEMGSSADYFCRNNLVRLDLNNNPFFRITKQSDGTYRVKVVAGYRIHVEVFYTKRINIRALVDNDEADLFSIPTSRVNASSRNPRHKSPCCPYCG